MEKVYYENISYMDQEDGSNIASMYKDFASKGVPEIWAVKGMDENEIYWFSKEVSYDWLHQSVQNVKVEILQNESYTLDFYKEDDIRFLLSQVGEVIIDGVHYINLSPFVFNPEN